jgi:nucleoside-diphosphate-sugar epimerase
MIIGNGLIASKFKEYKSSFEDCIIFASGVSDSESISESDFNREKNLLIETITKYPNLKLIYFSSILCEDIDKPYYKHKLLIENILKNQSKNYLIYRLPQVVGYNGNPNNLFNKLKGNIINNKTNNIYLNVFRSLIDVDDLVNFVIFSKNLTNTRINFSHIKEIKVSTLCIMISEALNKKPLITYTTSEKNSWNYVNSEIVDKWLINVDIENYNKQLIKKYI